MKWLVFCCLPLVLCFVRPAAAGDCCCHCGCQSNCSKVCRLVCEVTKVSKPVYDCECEDFCVPGKSDCCVVCDECGNRKKVYTPTCGQVRTRTKLVKHVETKEVKTYKCVVVDLCPACAQRLRGAGPRCPVSRPTGRRRGQPGAARPATRCQALTSRPFPRQTSRTSPARAGRRLFAAN